jgi:predicted dehydrogenase
MKQQHSTKKNKSTMTPPSKKIIRWGIMGPGKIARKFAHDLREVPDAKLYAVASRDQGRADAFANEYNAAKTFDSYEALAKDPDVDAVYIATPHALHKENSLLCMSHEKAVLCEKPLAMNATQVEEMITASKTYKVLLMEAMWTAFLPHFQAATQKVREGMLGEIISIEADFGFRSPFNPASRLFNKQLGGGSLLDIGIYPLFLSLSVLGKPVYIDARATFFENGADSSCDMTLFYRHNAKARLFSTLLKETPTEAVIKGSEGTLKLHSRFHESSSFTIEKEGKTQQFSFTNRGKGFVHEIEHFCNLLREGKTESPVMRFDSSRQLIGLLDEVREKIGLYYE